MGHFSKEYYKPINDLLDVLNEAHITEIKYGPGTQFVVRPDKFLAFNSKLAKANSAFVLTADNNLWEKIPEEPKSVIVLNYGPSSEYSYIKNMKNPKIILRIEGNNGSSIMFNRIKNGEGVNWGAETLETAAAIGLYASFDTELKALTKKSSSFPNESSIKKTIKKELNSDADWNQKGRSGITAILNNIAYVDLIQLLLLAEGMNRFFNEKVKRYITTPYFVHGSIAKFYEIERKQFKTSGVKDNTADLLITSVPSDKFFEAILKSKKINGDAKTGVCTIPGTDIKFIQCSLKKSSTGGQLGKITSLIVNMFSIPSYDKIALMALQEGVISNVVDGLKNLGKAIYDKITSVIKYIKDLPKTLVNDFNKLFDSQLSTDMKFLEKEMGLTPGSLQECCSQELNNYLSEAKKVDTNKIQATSQTLEKIQNNKKLQTILINNINKRYNELHKLTKKYKDSLFINRGAMLDPNGIYLKTDVTKLLINYTSLYVIKIIIETNLSSKDTSKLIESLFMIQKEMLFGKTELPLYKVYGLSDVTDTSHTYEYLGAGEKFVDSKMKDINESYNKLIIAIRCNPQDGKYFSIDTFILGGISVEDNELVPLYINVRTGAIGGDSKFTFNIEGTKTLTLKQLETNVINKGQK